MAKPKYSMQKGERIVYKVECCRHGFWGAYTDTLVVTNRCLLLEQYGVFNNFKGIVRYPYNEITQVILGSAKNGEKQLEVYIDNRIENFAPQSGRAITLNMLLLAVNDQMSKGADIYDFDFYKGLEDEILQRERNARSSSFDGIGFAADVALNMLTSGKFSTKSFQKSVNKAVHKQQRKQVTDGILEELGIHEIQDSFTEIANEFRREFAFEPKTTYAEIREAKEKEKQRFEAELIRKKREEHLDQVNHAQQDAHKKSSSKDKVNSLEPDQGTSITNKRMNVNEQLDMLLKLKELLDLGALTQEEFEELKQEILNS